MRKDMESFLRSWRYQKTPAGQQFKVNTSLRS
jgi:hypothetical protein